MNMKKCHKSMVLISNMPINEDIWSIIMPSTQLIKFLLDDQPWQFCFRCHMLYGWKDNQIYSHTKEMEHPFHFWVKSNEYFSGRCTYCQVAARDENKTPIPPQMQPFTY
jgi:hypothetical protein